MGNVLLTTTYQRAADATATGLLSAAAANQSRTTYAATWYDNVHRPTHVAYYGTNGGTAMPDTATGDFDPDTAGTQSYASFTPDPNGSDNIIVTKYEYDDAGRAYKVTANDGAATVTESDALGRTLAVIENYDDGFPGGSSGQSDIDRVTRYNFDTAGRLKEETADLPGTSDDQVTRYFYSGELDSDHDGSVVNSNSTLRATRYPDSTLTDQNVIDIINEAQGAPDSHDFVAFTYNAAGLAAATTDQREVVHTYGYDEIGRLTADTAALPQGSDVDDSVLAITVTYDAFGRVAKITSHSDADPDTAGFTDAVNQIEYAYDGWGNLITEKQEHDGAVDGNTLSVQYTYDWDDDPQTNEAAPYLRLAKITYPDGREVYYNYASGTADDISRVSEIADDDLDNGSRTLYATYSYLGAGTIVRVEHPAVTGGLTLDYGADGTDGWDRFGRVTGQTWTNAAETTTFDDFSYTYDRASNRLTRDLSLTTGLDEKYTYDALGRLTNTERGTLSAGSIINSTFEQDWSLDTLGNWDEFAEDADGDGTADLDQGRAHNDANEITGITETAGPSWIDPVHDAAGNMIQTPKPGAETTRLHLIYDAWGRLTQVWEDDGDGTLETTGTPPDDTPLSAYEYDGQNRRVQKTDRTGQSDVTYDYYHTGPQTVEVHKDADPDALKQYVWDLRYIDAPVVRFHDSDTDGTLDDTLYYCNDANFHVAALVSTAGAVVERYAYDPYGQVTILDADWSDDADSASDCDSVLGHQGLMRDTETGLIYNRARYLHPRLGRPLSRDLERYREGMNLYAYARGRPTVLLDPAGRASIYPDLASKGDSSFPTPPSPSGSLDFSDLAHSVHQQPQGDYAQEDARWRETGTDIVMSSMRRELEQLQRASMFRTPVELINLVGVSHSTMLEILEALSPGERERLIRRIFSPKDPSDALCRGLCPCPLTQPKPDDPVWKRDPDWAVRWFHPGAASSYKSVQEGQFRGNQCTYDRDHRLITHGPAAGTPDRAGGNSVLMFWRIYHHAELDAEDLFQELYPQSSLMLAALGNELDWDAPEDTRPGENTIAKWTYLLHYQTDPFYRPCIPANAPENWAGWRFNQAGWLEF